MNIKKYVLAITAAALSVSAFAYPAPQDEDATQQLLQQYTAQMQELQKSFDKNLLPPIKATAQLALEVQDANQEELTAQQEKQLEEYGKQLDTALTKLVAPALKDVDMGQVNEQAKQIAKAYNLPEQEVTLENLTDLMKGMYLMSAISYFEQTKKLTQEEVAVLAEILFPQEEE